MMRVNVSHRFAVAHMTGLVLALLLLIGPAGLQAQWSHDPQVNNPICTAQYFQQYSVLVGDGSGGAIIAWENTNRDSMGGNITDIYAQRIDSFGTVQWTTNGVVVSSAVGGQYEPSIVSDGSGGAIIAWLDTRNDNYDVYAQRINSSGTAQWTTDGVAICTAADYQYPPSMISDGSGGAIIAWNDHRNGADYGVYAQRINSSGITQWTTDGVAISTRPGYASGPILVGDGSGGAVIAWQYLTGPWNHDIYAQRVNSYGIVQWIANGVPICLATNEQESPAIVSDGSGGAIIAWKDRRNGADYDIYARRIRSSGALQWAVDGVAICTATGTQDYPLMAGDGSGGAIITWMDKRNGADYDNYAQRVSPTGTVQWTANGVAICTATGDQGPAVIVSDGAGGSIVTWRDGRSGTNNDIYAQHINSPGIVLWTANGIAICTATGNQGPSDIASDGSGGAIITWSDGRVPQADIYAQMVDRDGLLGGVVGVRDTGSVPLDFTLYGNSPNPFGWNTSISYALPIRQYVSLKVFNVLGREVATLVDGVENAGIKTATFNAVNLPSGIYTYRLSVLPEGAGADKAFVSVKKMLVLR